MRAGGACKKPQPAAVPGLVTREPRPSCQQIMMSGRTHSGGCIIGPASGSAGHHATLPRLSARYGSHIARENTGSMQSERPVVDALTTSAGLPLTTRRGEAPEESREPVRGRIGGPIQGADAPFTARGYLPVETMAACWLPGETDQRALDFLAGCQGKSGD